MARVLAPACLLLLWGVACLEPEAQPCGSLICAPGSVCNTAGYACVSPDLVTCGDGETDWEAGEECDDGNLASGDGCSDACRYEICGNAVENQPNDEGVYEECDCGVTAEMAATAALECNGMPNSDEGGYCRSDCRRHCGDSAIRKGEECDSLNLAGASCMSLDLDGNSDPDFDFGTLHCNACAFDTFECGRIGWYYNTLPEGTSSRLQAVWGSGNSVFAVGYGGTLVHHDGRTWRAIDPDTTRNLFAVTGTSAQDVYAVGNRNVLVHYNGVTAQVYEPEIKDRGTQETLVGVWAASAAEVFAISRRGHLLRRELELPDPTNTGGDQELPPGQGTYLWTEEVRMADGARALWGADVDDIYIVSGTGEIHHYSGDDRTEVVRADATYRAIWGIERAADSYELFAVGDSGAIAHYDGQGWESQSSGTTAALLSVWGSAADDVFAAGEDGTMLHYTDGVWTELNTVPPGSSAGEHVPQTFVSGWSLDATHVFAVDGNLTGEPRVWRYHGLAWGLDPSETDMGRVHAVWGRRGGDSQSVLVATGDGQQGGAIWRHGGTTLEREARASAPLHGLWGHCDGVCTVYAVGERGVVLRHDGATWEEVDVMWAGSQTVDLLGVWVSPEGHVFASGTGGTILRYDAGSDLWTVMPIETTTDLTAIWGRAADDVFAVGTNGLVYHYNGTSWQVSWANGDQPPPLYGLWGNHREVYAVGGVRAATSRSEILRYSFEDGKWHEVTDIQAAQALRAVWTSELGKVYAVGDDGLVVHYNGTTWAPVRTNTPNQLAAVWGSEDVTFFAGDNGTLLTLHGELP